MSADYNQDPDSSLNINGVFLLYNDSTKNFVRHYDLINNATECRLRPIENGFIFHKDGSISAISCNFDSLNVYGDSILFDEALFNKVITIKGCTGVYRVSGDKLLISIIYRRSEMIMLDWELETLKANIIDGDMFYVYYNRDTGSEKKFPHHIAEKKDVILSCFRLWLWSRQCRTTEQRIESGCGRIRRI